MISPVVHICMLVSAVQAISIASHRQDCEPISVPLCRSLPYNLTRFPSTLHLSQSTAGKNLQKYDSLMRTKCSKYLVFFLCTQSLPICLEAEGLPHPIMPCRSVCQKVKQDCMPAIRRLGGKWPRNHDCSLLPEKRAAVCLTPDSFVDEPSMEGKNLSHACHFLKSSVLETFYGI